MEALTDLIVRLNWGMTVSYVRKFTSNTSRDDSDDFQGAATVGLMRAISTFDPKKGRFGSWAFKPIQREVLRAVRDADHPNLNLGDFEKRPVILAAERDFLAEAGPDAPLDHADIARRAGVTEGQVRRVLEAPRLDSLSAPQGGQDEDDLPWEDRIADPTVVVEDEVLLRFDLQAVSRRGLPLLDKRERYVLTRRFGLDGGPEQPLRAIGEQLGLSREGVRQIQEKALAKLNAPIANAG
jgi:RNA polymerase primary sigma factor/RNA polymerase nonessential primary-like sigma factor